MANELNEAQLAAMSPAQLLVYFKAQNAEMAKVKADAAAKVKEARANVRPVKMKVAEKGGLSIYGLMRFPITLYKAQWLQLLDMADKIRSFITANNHALKDKDE